MSINIFADLSIFQIIFTFVISIIYIFTIAIFCAGFCIDERNKNNDNYIIYIIQCIVMVISIILGYGISDGKASLGDAFLCIWFWYCFVCIFVIYMCAFVYLVGRHILGRERLQNMEKFIINKCEKYKQYANLFLIFTMIEGIVIGYIIGNTNYEKIGIGIIAASCCIAFIAVCLFVPLKVRK